MVGTCVLVDARLLVDPNIQMLGRFTKENAGTEESVPPPPFASSLLEMN